MSKNTNPDRVFAEDPEMIPLKHEREVLLTRLRALIGPELSASSMPSEAPPHWPQEAAAPFARYLIVTDELSRLNSRHTSRQLTRFLSADTEGVEQTRAMRQWWWDRY
ncbi:MAG: hypothetical protein KDA67_04400 [Rhodobacteraceae bacterium]|nr:hypothetical protein [Paracoccaceae bacterium]